jgi:hypothetical protein
LAKELSGAEKAFVDYMIIMGDNAHKGDFDTVFPAPTNVMTLEMGDVAFAELSGVHDHVSCKSGQDRTLTLTALRLAVAEVGWPTMDTAAYKGYFAVAFFKAVAAQAKPVVEHARGDGGKLKFNLEEKLLRKEQPVPGALFAYMQSADGEDARLSLRKIITENPNLREGLKTVKLPRGLFRFIVYADASLAAIGETKEEIELLKSFFTKEQSSGKKTLVDLFQKTMEIKNFLEELKGSKTILTGTERQGNIARLETCIANLDIYLGEARGILPGRVSSLKNLAGTPQTTKLKVYFEKYAQQVLQEAKIVKSQATIALMPRVSMGTGGAAAVDSGDGEFKSDSDDG